MNAFIFVLGVTFILVSGSSALKCYSCMVENKTICKTGEETCGTGSDACLKLNGKLIGGVKGVIEMCGPSAVCTGPPNCTAFKSEPGCSAKCCKTDLCDWSASSASSKLQTVMAIMVAALLFAFFN